MKRTMTLSRTCGPLAAVVVAGQLLSACAGGPPVAYEGVAAGPAPERGSIGIQVRAFSPYSAGRLEAAEAVFVRIEPGTDLYAEPAFIMSNHQGRDGRVYLLDVAPGRYAAVAYRTRGGNPFLMADKQWIFFEKPLIDQTVVDVEPGGFVFGGEYTVGGTPWRGDAESLDEDALNAADTAQVHYLALMFPDAENKSTLARIYGKNPVYLGNYLPSRSAGRTAEAEREFWSDARKSADLHAAWWPDANPTGAE